MRDQLRLLASMASLSVVVYMAHGLLAHGLGGGMARGLVVAAGVATAFLLPRALVWLRRQPSRSAALEAMQAELAVQSSARGVEEVLVAHVRLASGAEAVTLALLERPPIESPVAPATVPSGRYGLGAPDQPFGEVRLYGPLRNEPLVHRLVRVGGLALQNALLAERSADAERARSQAQAQRDLQHRLTWTVTTQVCTLLEETRQSLEDIRQCAGTLPADLLAQDLDALSRRLGRLEAFVHDNLKNANSIHASVSPDPLARLSRPR